MIKILEPTQIIDGHLVYSPHMTILVEVEPVGSMFKKVLLVDPISIHFPRNYPPDPSQLILYATAYCAPCAEMHVPDARWRCDPVAFFLLPRIESPITVLMYFDDSNTRFSQIATFKFPPRGRQLSDGQSPRCDRESLMYVVPLIPSPNRLCPCS